MPDLSTVYLPPFPELSVDVAGDLGGDRAGDAPAAPASDSAAPESASGRDGSGGDGAPVLPVECRWSGRVRTFDVAGTGTVTACPAARRSGWKKSFSVPSPSSAAAPAPAPGRTLEEHVKEWAARKAAAGVPAQHCELPFLTGAPKAVECRLCSKIIYPGEGIQCSVNRCREMFHLTCAAKDNVNLTAESFKCPQHGCMVCKQKMFFWRCGRCTVAAHTKCAPWPLIHLKDDQGSAICWRHPSDWLLQNENADLTNNTEEVFRRLPLPYVNEDFNIDSTIRHFTAIVYKPPPYTLIRRSILK